MDELDESIKQFRKLLDATTAGDPDEAKWSNNLAVRLSRRYYMTKSIVEINEAIQLARRALDITPRDHELWAKRAANLALYLSTRYKATVTDIDIEEAVLLIEQAISAASDDNPERSNFLVKYGLILRARYSKTKEVVDLERAAQAVKDGVLLTSEYDPKLANRLRCLGLCLDAKYSVTKSKSDLQDSIHVSRRAIEATPKDDPELAGALTDLGNAVYERFLNDHDMIDLEEAIQLARQAVDAFPNAPPYLEYTFALDNLATRLNIKYGKTGSESDLNEAILIFQRGIDATSDDEPGLATRCRQLGHLLGVRYKDSREIADLQEAIQANKRAIDATPKGDPDLKTAFNNLGVDLHECYKRTGSRDNLEESIQMTKSALVRAPGDSPDPWLAENHMNLARRLASRYRLMGIASDIEEAIREARISIDMMDEKDPLRPARFGDLGKLLTYKYETSLSLDDLEEAIRIERQALNLTPDDDPVKAQRLAYLAFDIGEKYSRTEDIADLNEAISMGRQIVHAFPNWPDRGNYMHDLALDLWKKYLKTQTVADLNESVQMARLALEAASGGPRHASFATLLRMLLTARSYRTGENDDLEEAVQLARHAVDLQLEYQSRGGGVQHGIGERGIKESFQLDAQEVGTSTTKEHRDLLMYLNCLADGLSNKYGRTGQVSDLEEGIRMIRKALDITSDDHPDRAYMEYTLITLLRDRHSRSRDVADIEEGILLARKGLDLTPQTSTLHIDQLHMLSALLEARYLRTWGVSDLDESIQILKQAILLIPEGDQNIKPNFLNSLGCRLGDKFLRTKALPEIDEAVSIIREAIALTPEDHGRHPMLLRSLGSLLENKYSVTEELGDLEDAIEISRKSLGLIPKDHAIWASQLYRLGFQLHLQFLHSGDTSDVNEAMRLARMAVESASEDSPDHARSLLILGQILEGGFKQTRDLDALEEAEGCYEAILIQANCPIITRVQAGLNYVRVSLRWDPPEWEQVFHASTSILDLLPQFMTRSVQHSDQQYTLGQFAGAASDGAAAALACGMSPATALGILEKGRGLLGNSIEEIWTDLQDLEAKHPQLSGKYRDLRMKLQALSIDQIASQATVDATYSQADQNQRYEIGKRFDNLIDEVRRLPGFEDLGSLGEADLLASGCHGPVIVINVCSERCDAILVEKHQIRSFQLPHVDGDDIEKKAKEPHLGRSQILEWLWESIVGPILDALGLTGPPSGDDWPHVWWVPTGALSKFPLHAAGYHRDSSGRTVLDRVVSSYSSSIKALIHGRRRPTQASQVGNAILVAMENTPGLERAPLRFATEELVMVKGLFRSMRIDYVTPNRNKKDVISHLRECRIFHFAGHGYTDALDPSQSHLRLEDWEKNPLRVADLLDVNLRDKSPFLAYLSACGTGRVMDDTFVDESIHLISGCQLAGFRHVIGTLWEVDDAVCLDMAKLTYEGMREEMKDGIMTDDLVSRGLHRATRELRDRWLKTTLRSQPHSRLTTDPDLSCEVEEMTLRGVSDRNCGDVRESREWRKARLYELTESTPHWVPYVHFGA